MNNDASGMFKVTSNEKRTKEKNDKKKKARRDNEQKIKKKTC